VAKEVLKAMFHRRHWLFLVIAGLLLAACAAPQSHWRADAVSALHVAREDSAEKILPEEFDSVTTVFSQAELLLRQGKPEEADRFYQMAVIKGTVLHENVIARNNNLLHEAGEANRAAMERERDRQLAENEVIFSLRPAVEPPGKRATTGYKREKGVKPTLYLTFDDGPSPLTLPIARYLKSEGIHATFFAVGGNIKGHEQLVKDTIGYGHLVANHTFSHNARRLSAGPAALNGEIDWTRKLLEPLGGDGLLVRIPYGSSILRCRLTQIANPSVQVIDWDVDSCDTRPLGIGNHAYIIRSVLSQIKMRHKENIVLLFHDGAGHQETLVALKELVPRLKREGYRFAGLSRESQVAWVRNLFRNRLVAATKTERRPQGPL
jgi:peptidoglycan/xylan/chitin deacetylase (PgdA/CDA1 family)